MRAWETPGLHAQPRRMVVASFFASIFLDWRLENGTAAHFAFTCRNVGGWQWAAGSGCDAATSASSIHIAQKFDRLRVRETWVRVKPRPTPTHRGPQNGPPTRHRHLQSGALCRLLTLGVPWGMKGCKGLKCGLSSVLAGPLTVLFWPNVVPSAEGGSTWRGCHPDVARPRSSHDQTSAYLLGQHQKASRLEVKQARMASKHSRTRRFVQNMKWRDSAHGFAARLASFHLVHIRLVGHDMDPSRLAYDVVIQAETGSCP